MTWSVLMRTNVTLFLSVVRNRGILHGTTLTYQRIEVPRLGVYHRAGAHVIGKSSTGRRV